MNKIPRLLIIIVIFFITLIYTNTYTTYTKINGSTNEIIKEQLPKEYNNKKVYTEKELEYINSKIKKISINNKEQFQKLIIDNDQLDVLKNIETIEFNVDGENYVNLTEENIDKIKEIKNFKNIVFNLEIDEFYLIQEYGYDYTKENKEEFIKVVKKVYKSSAEKTFKNLESKKVKYEIKVEIY